MDTILRDFRPSFNKIYGFATTSNRFYMSPRSSNMQRSSQGPIATLVMDLWIQLDRLSILVHMYHLNTYNMVALQVCLFIHLVDLDIGYIGA